MTDLDPKNPPECIYLPCKKKVAFVGIIPYDGDYLRCEEHIGQAMKVAQTFVNRLTDFGRQVTWAEYCRIKEARDGRAH